MAATAVVRPMALGDFIEDATINFHFNTMDYDNSLRTFDGTAINIYKGSNATQSTAGVSFTADFDSITGFNLCTIDTSADAFYANNDCYSVVVADGTWAGQIIARFTIGMSPAAADPWSTALPGSYGAGTAGSRLGRVPDVAAGASGGLFIAGSNAATTVASLTCTGEFTVSNGVVVTCSTSNKTAFSVTGNGTGHGGLFTGGSGATGDGLRCQSAATDGCGLFAGGTGASAGGRFTNPSTGHGLQGDTTGGSGAGIAGVGGTGSGSVGILARSTDSTTGGIGFHCLTSFSNGIAAKFTPSGTGLALSAVGPVTVTGATTLAGLSTGALSCTTLTASGAVEFQNNFDVDGAMTFGGTFDIVGAALLNSFTVANAMTVGTNAIPWNAAWDTQVQSECEDAIVVYGLDHLLAASVAGTDITDNSIIAKMVSKSATADWDSFTNTTDSLEAIRDAITAVGDPWSTALPGSYGAGTAGRILGHIPDIAAGASGGIFIAGSNAATTVDSLTCTGTFTISDGLVVSRSTSNASGIVVTGNGTGHGATITSGGGATGDGLRVSSGATNGSGLAMTGAGTGHAANLVGTINVSGLTTLAGLTTGALSCTTITASGAVAFQSTFAVTTSTSLAALSCTTLTASGAVSFQSTFGVTGTTTFNAFTVTNNFLVSGATTFTGVFTAAAGFVNTYPAGAYYPSRVIDSGTAQSVTGTTLVLRSGAAFADSELVGATIVIRSASTGAGQSRRITANVGATDTVTVATWTTTPTGTIVYDIYGTAAEAAATDPWSVAVPGSYGAGTAGSRLGRIPDIAAGSANGLFIAGSNAATTVATFTCTGDFAVGNDLIINADVFLGTSVYVDGNVDFAGNFTVGGTTNLNGAVSFGGTFDVVGAALFGSTFGITGTTSLAAVSTSGTVTLNALTVSNATTLTGVVSATAANDIRGVVLRSNGLDSISTTAPSGVASNFREMLVQVWRRFFKRTSTNGSLLRTYADDGTTVVTTQAYTTTGETPTEQVDAAT